LNLSAKNTEKLYNALVNRMLKLKTINKNSKSPAYKYNNKIKLYVEVFYIKFGKPNSSNTKLGMPNCVK